VVNRRPRTARLPSGRGVALVDAIVGAILLGVALAVLVGLTGQAIGAQARGQRLATAAALADEQLSLVLARGPDDYAKSHPADGRCEDPFGDFAFSLEFSGGSDREPFRVRVTITWMDGATPRSLAVETLMASRRAGGVEPDPPRAPAAVPERTP